MILARIIVLTALTLVSIVPLAKPVLPSLHVQAFTGNIPVTSLNLVGCGPETFTASFQENVTGRDAASTLVVYASSFGVNAYQNVSPAVLQSHICAGTTVQLIPYLVGVGTDLTIRPLADENYTLWSQGYDFSSSPNQYRLFESWTVSTIS